MSINCRSGTMVSLQTCVSLETPNEPAFLWLDADERRLRGIDMKPLLTGESALLACLGSRPRVWHRSSNLAVSIFRRADRGGRQLVWKYASTLRMKLAPAMPELVIHCRRRGYCCLQPIILLPGGHESGAVRTI